MYKPLFDEGSWCYLKGVTPLVLIISAIGTFLIWLSTIVNRLLNGCN